MELFQHRDTLISVLCGNIASSIKSSNVVERLRQNLKHLFPDIFSEVLGCSTNTNANFAVKQSACQNEMKYSGSIYEVNRELETSWKTWKTWKDEQ